jgi:hypothetical protein
MEIYMKLIIFNSIQFDMIVFQNFYTAYLTIKVKEKFSSK